VTLDATPAGQPLYLREGFVETFRFDRCVRPAATPPSRGPVDRRVRPMTAADLPTVIALDAAVFGVPRPAAIDAYDRSGWAEWLTQAGFVRERTLARMTRGSTAAPAAPDTLFAVSGPELG
jgi:hypothetical protein